MKYRTTCPHCLSVFGLGADQLDAAQGWVQCGVCGAAFDARPHLLREDGTPLPVVESETPAPSLAADTTEAQPDATQAQPDATQAQADATQAQPNATQAQPNTEAQPDAAPDADSDATPSVMPIGITQRQHTEDDLPSIILIDPDIAVPDDPGPLPQIHAAPSSSLYSTTAPPAGATTVTPSFKTTAAPSTPATRIEYAAPGRVAPRKIHTPRRAKTGVWITASIVLLLVLAAQTAYFLRDTLVSRFPELRPGIAQACVLIGCRLSLPQDASQVRILGSDLQAEPGNARQLRLTLTLSNHARYAQAWPILVLTLTDRRDQPQARRSFAPSEYLADPVRETAGMAATTEYPLTLTLTTRDLALAGYRLELMY